MAQHRERVGVLVSRVVRIWIAAPSASGSRRSCAIPSDRDEHRLLGELRADRPRGVEPGGAVGQLELGGVGENDLQAHLGPGGAAPTSAVHTSRFPGSGDASGRRHADTRLDAADRARLPGPFGSRAGRAPAVAGRLRPAARPGGASRPARSRRGRRVAHAARPARTLRRAARRATTRDAASRPRDAWGHDHLWWLDRMVRTSRPLVERMTLVWHDWFATSNDGVGSQRLMLDQNALLRRHALGSFAELLADVTTDPAMLLWLSGIDNEKRAPNENYGRELMELFTLGEGNGYTERDVREQARALTGLDVHAGTKSRGPTRLPLRRERHDDGAQDDLRPTAAHSTGGRVLAVPRAPEAPARSSSRSSGAYFIPAAARREHAAMRSSALYSRTASRSGPWSRRSCRHPALYTRARAWSSRRSSTPPGCCAGSTAAIDTDGVGVAHRRRRPASLLPAERRGLGRRVAWLDTQHLPRALVRSPEPRCEKYTLAVPKKGRPRKPVPSPPEEIVEAALALLGNPTVRTETRRGADPLRPSVPAPRDRLEGGRVPAPRDERRPRISLAVSPDYQTELMGCCREHSRSALLRHGVARGRARASPPSSPGMPLPAGTGLDRRALLLRSAPASHSPSTARSSLAPASFEEGIGDARAATARQQVLVSVFLDGGADSLSMLAPVGDPRYRKLRPSLALAPGAGRAVRRGRAAALAPFARAARDTPRRGQGDRPPRRSATRTPNQSHFTSRHFWEVGATDERLARPAGSAAISTASAARQPAPGPLARLEPRRRRSPRRRFPVAAVDAPDGYDFWSRGVWGEVRAADGRLRSAASGALPTGGDPGLAQATAAHAPSARLHASAAAVPAEGRRQGELRPHGAVPADGRSVPAPARRPRRDARGRTTAAASSRSRPPAAYDTHDSQAGELPGAPQADGRLPARLPARPRGARPRRPRARPRLVGVRPPRGRERLAAPITARRVSAS